jgi:hypothetical protein
MPQVELTGGNVLVTLAVILIILEGISVLSKGVEAWKKLTGRDERAREMTSVKGRITDLEVWRTTVDQRLLQGNKRFDESSKDTIAILMALHRIVKHLQSGNDHDKLKETDDQLFDYLVKRGVNPQTLE